MDQRHWKSLTLLLRGPCVSVLEEIRSSPVVQTLGKWWCSKPFIFLLTQNNKKMCFFDLSFFLIQKFTNIHWSRIYCNSNQGLDGACLQHQGTTLHRGVHRYLPGASARRGGGQGVPEICRLRWSVPWVFPSRECWSPPTPTRCYSYLGETWVKFDGNCLTGIQRKPWKFEHPKMNWIPKQLPPSTRICRTCRQKTGLVFEAPWQFGWTAEGALGPLRQISDVSPGRHVFLDRKWSILVGLWNV